MTRKTPLFKPLLFGTQELITYYVAKLLQIVSRLRKENWERTEALKPFQLTHAFL